MNVRRERTLANGARFLLVQGDITAQQVDAIVNAANSRLAHGGGVAAVIARKGGSVVWRQSQAWVREHGPVSHERPAYTECGNLPCRYIIHAVGPIWRGGTAQEDEKLRAAVLGSLRRADELGVRSIAFPAISTGVYRFPKDRAARIFYRAIEDYFRDHPQSHLQEVRLVLYDRPTLEAFLQVWDATATETAQ